MKRPKSAAQKAEEKAVMDDFTIKGEGTFEEYKALMKKIEAMNKKYMQN
jgi:hypothetical protein